MYPYHLRQWDIKNLIFLKPKMVALHLQDYIRYTNKVCHGNQLRQTLGEFKYHFIPKDVCLHLLFLASGTKQGRQKKQFGTFIFCLHLLFPGADQGLSPKRLSPRGFSRAESGEPAAPDGQHRRLTSLE